MPDTTPLPDTTPAPDTTPLPDTKPHSLSASLTTVIDAGVAGWAELPFIAGIRAGTLEPALFRNYLEQDYIYLYAYARHYSRLAAQSTDDETLEYFIDLAHGVVAVELVNHRKVGEPFGCDFGQVRPSAETRDYLAFYDSLRDDPDEMLVAMLPCVYGYGVAMEMLRPVADGPYQAWVELYTGQDYAALVDQHLRLIDQARLATPRALEITEQALDLEYRFWNQLPVTTKA